MKEERSRGKEEIMCVWEKRRTAASQTEWLRTLHTHDPTFVCHRFEQNRTDPVLTWQVGRRGSSSLVHCHIHNRGAPERSTHAKENVIPNRFKTLRRFVRDSCPSEMGFVAWVAFYWFQQEGLVFVSTDLQTHGLAAVWYRPCCLFYCSVPALLLFLNGKFYQLKSLVGVGLVTLCKRFFCVRSKTAASSTESRNRLMRARRGWEEFIHTVALRLCVGKWTLNYRFGLEVHVPRKYFIKNFTCTVRSIKWI